MKLDASQFRGSRHELIVKEFNAVIKLFFHCHENIRKDKAIQVPANEEWIRNVFLAKYVRLNKVKFSLGHLNFDAETAEIDPTSGATLGYIDIKVTNILHSPISDENEYYAFECKRINSSTRYALKESYVFEGIMRFVNGKYSRQMNIAGMIGFIENNSVSEAPLIEAINEILRTDFPGTTNEYLNAAAGEEGVSSIISKHPRSSSQDISISHLFMNLA